MRNTICQIVVTFHGGMIALGYEWGSINHPPKKDKSPDNIASQAIAARMAEFAGSFTGVKQYPSN
jgi:hypothetical protein